MAGLWERSGEVMLLVTPLDHVGLIVRYNSTPVKLSRGGKIHGGKNSREEEVREWEE
jgi:hypothetical protein